VGPDRTRDRMHAVKINLLFSLLLGACAGSDAGTSTETDPGTTGTTGTTAPPGTTTGDVHVTTGGETHAHETSSHHDASSGDHDDSTGHDDASTGHDDETTAGEHGTAEHGTETGGGSSAEQYCFCMLENCHDQYHATWGEEHPQSEEMCLTAAEAVPSVGMPAMSGNSLECRLHFCELGHDDPTACDIALGAAPCVD